jgi:FkbM family methyltransferase
MNDSSPAKAHLTPQTLPIFEKSEGIHSITDIARSVVRSFSKTRMIDLSESHLRARRKQVAIFAFDTVGMNINEDGVFELHELETFFDWIDSKGIDLSEATALDIGANIGNHGLFFSDRFKKVHCFEPSKRTFSILKINAELVNNIECHNVGLSSSNREATLQLDQMNVGGASVSDTGKGESILLKRLDDLDLGSDDIKLVKIDVEGHEFDALLGAKKTIEKHAPIILFEQLPQEIWKMTSRTVDLLRSYGYVRFAIVGRTPNAPSFVPAKLKPFSVLFLKLFRPTTTRVSVTAGFESKFYSLIIAIPGWLRT